MPMCIVQGPFLVRFVSVAIRYMEISMYLAICFVARYVEISMYLAICFIARYMEISMYLATKHTSRYMEISMYLALLLLLFMMCCERYMEISMYLAICFVKEKKWQRLLELLINLPIVFKIGKINKIRVVSCQEKAASYMLLTKNKPLDSLFTIFDAFLLKTSF